MDDHTSPKIDVNNPQTVVQIVDDLPIQQIKKPSRVPPVVIASQSSSSSRNLTRKRVESVKKLGEHMARAQSTQRSARQSPPMNRATRKKIIDNDDDHVLPATLTDDPSLSRKKKSFLPCSVDTLAGKKLDQPKKMYTEKEVWDLIQSCNPTLHDFGKKHNLHLDDLEVFAACMEEIDINPKLITEYLHGNNPQEAKGIIRNFMDRLFGDPYDNHLDRLHKQYEKMQHQDPEGYKEMLLELMKAAADQEENKQTNRSAIVDTHTSLQNKEIANQVKQTRLAIAGLIVTFITSVGGWAFGIIGQSLNPGNCTS